MLLHHLVRRSAVCGCLRADKVPRPCCPLQRPSAPASAIAVLLRGSSCLPLAAGHPGVLPTGMSFPQPSLMQCHATPAIPALRLLPRWPHDLPP
jgi:hypothetical protein